MRSASPEIDAICEDQFKFAKDHAHSYLYAVNIDHYDFGRAAGKDILFAHDAPGAETLVMLDIGAGEGTFLSEIQRHTRRHIRPIGLTAAQTRVQAPALKNEIEWVYGDIQRTDTWRPDGTLQPESVDVAVSSLTFRHLVDPLRAIQNAITVLKHDAELFIDKIPIVLNGEDSNAAAECVIDELNGHRGEYGFASSVVSWAGTFPGLSTLFITDAHFRRQAAPPTFGPLKPRATFSSSPLVVYELNPAP